jgi:hypothetical protein
MYTNRETPNCCDVHQYELEVIVNFPKKLEAKTSGRSLLNPFQK